MIRGIDPKWNDETVTVFWCTKAMEPVLRAIVEQLLPYIYSEFPPDNCEGLSIAKMNKRNEMKVIFTAEARKRCKYDV